MKEKLTEEFIKKHSFKVKRHGKEFELVPRIKRDRGYGEPEIVYSLGKGYQAILQYNFLGDNLAFKVLKAEVNKFLVELTKRATIGGKFNKKSFIKLVEQYKTTT